MCTLSAMHKSQMFFLSAGPRAVNMLEHGDENQTTTNKCFLLPTAAILEQITKGLFRTLDSGRPKSCVFPKEECRCFSHTSSFFVFFFSFIFHCLSFHVRLMREFLFGCIACVVSRSLSACRFGRVTKSSPRAKQTAVAHG